MRGTARYWELVLAVPPDVAEGFTNFLWESGALGVVEEERPGQRPELRAFFPETTAPAVLSERVTAYADALVALGFGAVGRLVVESLEDTGWADAWREHFRPRAIGRRFLVTPPWETPVVGDRIALVIEPGRAFGTGHHGSTAGCLEAIEHAVTGGVPSYAIDLGTGSGILAIALAKVGVARVYAVDEDPDAVAAATANAERNGVSAAVACRMGDAAELDVEPAPLVMANLITTAHRRLGDRYARYVTPSGHIVLSGILDAEAAHVAATMHARGWHMDDDVSHEGWTTLTFRRSGDR